MQLALRHWPQISMDSKSCDAFIKLQSKSVQLAKTEVLKLVPKLKGRSLLAHMRIRYHFIANLHITETRSIPFLTKCDKNSIIG